VALAVGRSLACRSDRQELVAGVEERRLRTVAPAVLERHQAAVERERGVDVGDLQGDMVEAQEPGAGAGSLSGSHRAPPGGR
jgi:hypothetical protein